MCQLALQQSPLAHHSNSPCFVQFCDFDLILLKFCFIKGPYTIRFFKIQIDCWTRGIRLCLIHFQKRKIIIIIFSKKKKKKWRFQKIMHPKLWAFGHASSILKKKNHIFLKSQGFQYHASICRLGAFSYASFR